MPKIAVIIDAWFPFIGGAQIHCLEISKRLNSKYSIDILTPNKKGLSTKAPENINIIPIGPRISRYSALNRLLFCLFVFYHLTRHKYNLIHAHAFLPGIPARLAMVFMGIPSIFTVHGVSFNTKYSKFGFLEKFLVTGIKYSEEITVSRDLLKIKNINKKIIYIPNAPTITQKTAKSPKGIILLTIARLHKQKNLHNYLDSILMLSKRVPDIKAIIVGTGPEEKSLKEDVQNLGITKNIIFLKNQTKINLLTLYQKASFFVLPSAYEGQSLSILDALATFTPVVTTSTGDNIFLIKNGHNGFLINYPFDPKQLADLLYSVIKNKNLEKIKANGYNLVKNEFNWTKTAKLTDLIYEKYVKTRTTH